MSGSAPGGGVAPGIPGAIPGTFWSPAPGLPGQPPSGTMVIELDPMDREHQMVEDEMQSTIREHRDNAGNRMSEEDADGRVIAGLSDVKDHIGRPRRANVLMSLFAPLPSPSLLM